MGERLKSVAAQLDAVVAIGERYRVDPQGYTDGKAPFIWVTLREADAWAQATGWAPGPSDA